MADSRTISDNRYRQIRVRGVTRMGGDFQFPHTLARSTRPEGTRPTGLTGRLSHGLLPLKASPPLLPRSSASDDVLCLGVHEFIVVPTS